MKRAYRVLGLDCAEEVRVLKKALLPLPGIVGLEFQPLQGKMVVEYDPLHITPEQIVENVATTGMQALSWDEQHLSLWQRQGRLILTLASGLSLLLALLFHLPIFYLTAIVCGVWFVLPKAYYAVRRLTFDMNLLMVVAILGALFIRQWFEGASVAFLFSLALLLEQWSVKRAYIAIGSLIELAPKRAHLLDRGEVDVNEVRVGDVIVVRAGEKVPLDATVLSGSSSIDESTLTGESLPVFKQAGDLVYAGTLNQEGALHCRVLQVATSSTLSRMVALVEEARLKKSASEQWVDTFATYYTPIMFLFALLIVLIPPLVFAQPWVPWIYRSLVLLVIACPCALVIATPVSIISGLTTAARLGVLIKGGLFLEEMSKIKALAVDKTGTLTYGHPEVQEVIPFQGHTEQELMQKAAALEEGSDHPLARAIARRAQLNERATHFQNIPGKGAQALYKGKLFWIGSHRFMHEMGQETAEIHACALRLEDAGHSVVAIGNAQHVCGLISIADAPREGIAQIMQEIREAGVEEIVMLTGDNEPTARAIAQLANISYQAEVLAEEKMEQVLRLQQRWGKVAMIGDGVNDAAAMAAAQVGIAMGKRGSGVALETSDIVLMSDDLTRVAWLMRYSRRVLTILRQNIWFALGVKLAFVLLALSQLATLWMAVAADTGATLLVIFNSLRLLKGGACAERLPLP